MTAAVQKEALKHVHGNHRAAFKKESDPKDLKFPRRHVKSVEIFAKFRIGDVRIEADHRMKSKPPEKNDHSIDRAVGILARRIIVAGLHHFATDYKKGESLKLAFKADLENYRTKQLVRRINSNTDPRDFAESLRKVYTPETLSRLLGYYRQALEY